MSHAPRCFLTVLTLLSLFAGVQAGHAAEPYQGIYVLIDPYAPYDVGRLRIAASAPCPSHGSSTTTPFCSAANGILLRFPWCDFQLYHVTDKHNRQYPSCHYQVGYSSGVLQHGVQRRSSDMVSACSGMFDTCLGQPQSTLSAALAYIVQINAQRAASGLPPLALSIGMYPGIGTPQSVFDALGYVDVPYMQPGSLTSNANECYRLPLPWTGSFLAAYQAAVDQLMAYMQTQMPQGMNVTMFKAAAVTASDLEVEQPGQPDSVAAPSDPGPGVGPLLHCSGKPGAQTWLDAYNAAPNPDQTFAQANEAATGAMIGHLTALAANLGYPNALISLPTTDNSAFAYVDCGVTGASACQVDAMPAPWSTYYLDLFVDDLFHGGLSYVAAAAAYGAMRGDGLVLPPGRVAINATDLGQVAPVSSQSQPCIINNTDPANNPQYLLNGVSVSVGGVGTVIGWQTKFNESGTCSNGGYGQTLTNGLNEGSLFEEVQTDAAFAHLASCGPALSSTLAKLLAAVPPSTCVYH